MKGIQVVFDFEDDRGLLGTVVSEPYPKLRSGFGAPPRNGGTYSTTDSTTCVSIEGDSGKFYHDISVGALRKYTPPVPFYTWLKDQGMGYDAFVHVSSHLNHRLSTEEAAVTEYNAEITRIEKSIEACTSSKLPIPKNMLEFYFDSAVGFQGVDSIYSGTPCIIFSCETEVPKLSHPVYEDYDWEKEHDQGFSISRPNKLAVDWYLLEELLSLQERIKDINASYNYLLSKEELTLLNKVIEVVYGRYS